jgi:hypothetical protein
MVKERDRGHRKGGALSVSGKGIRLGNVQNQRQTRVSIWVGDASAVGNMGMCSGNVEDRSYKKEEKGSESASAVGA